jgi:hypothetical protein
MKVIKVGDQIKAELKIKQTKRFECMVCGCQFDCNKDEYKTEAEDRPGCTPNNYATCPTCGETVYRTIPIR